MLGNLVKSAPQFALLSCKTHSQLPFVLDFVLSKFSASNDVSRHTYTTLFSIHFCGLMFQKKLRHWRVVAFRLFPSRLGVFRLRCFAWVCCSLKWAMPTNSKCSYAKAWKNNGFFALRMQKKFFCHLHFIVKFEKIPIKIFFLSILHLKEQVLLLNSKKLIAASLHANPQ